MAWTGFTLPDRPRLPEQGFSFEVSCRPGPQARATRHRVTLGPDWSLHTPHDLDAERVAAALGGGATCVEVADAVLPAARGFVEHRHRLARAGVVFVSAGTWRLTYEAQGCGCADTDFATAGEAAAHLRQARHWALLYRARPAQVTRLAGVIAAALGVADDEPVIPRASGLLGVRVTNSEALATLWEAGLHPRDVEDLAAGLGAPGPLPVHVLLTEAYATSRDPWLAQFVPFGGLVLAWAARERTLRDARDPGERRAFVEAGVPLPHVAQILAGSAYTLADARALAAALSRPLTDATRVLAHWQASGATPPLADLVELHRAGGGDFVPASAAVSAVAARASTTAHPVGRTEAGLALARAGNTIDAVALLRGAHGRANTPTPSPPNAARRQEPA